MCKLRRWTTHYVLWKALNVRMHQVRRMLGVRRVRCKVDECMCSLPVLNRLLRSMPVHLGYVPVWQLVCVGLLNRWASTILLRAVCQLLLRHNGIPCLVIWDLGGNLVALGQMFLSRPWSTNP